MGMYSVIIPIRYEIHV